MSSLEKTVIDLKAALIIMKLTFLAAPVGWSKSQNNWSNVSIPRNVGDLESWQDIDFVAVTAA